MERFTNHNVFDLFKVILLNTLGLSFSVTDAEAYMKIFVLALTAIYTFIKIYNEFVYKSKLKR